jgi:hypothetical protein
MSSSHTNAKPDERGAEERKPDPEAERIRADAEARRSDLEERRAQREADQKKYALEHALKERQLTSDLEEKRSQREADQKKYELDLVERRAQREADQRKSGRELALKAKELEASSGSGIKFTSAQATVAAAVLALISGGIGGVIQAWATRSVEASKSEALLQIEKVKAEGTLELEKQKETATEQSARETFETGLILKAIAASTRDEQVRNLQFFLKAGFISDRKGKIAQIDVVNYPSLPPTTVPVSADFPGLPAALVDIVRQRDGSSADPQVLRNLIPTVKALAKVPLNVNQLSALTAFVYNVGLVNFSNSTLLKEINDQNFDHAAEEFLRWNKLGGTESAQLTKLRTEEAELFKRPPSVNDENSQALRGQKSGDERIPPASVHPGEEGDSRTR